MTNRSSETMRAAVIDAVAPGSDEISVFVREVPVPKAGPDEVRIAVQASALNRADLAPLRNLKGPGLRSRRLPLVPGIDVAGTIDHVGEDASALGWCIGERVVAYPGLFCGTCRFCRRGEETMCDGYAILGEERDGGIAEYVTVPATNLKRIPSGVPFDVAAASPAAFTTAWRMLIVAGRLTPGDTVLITGVGSGVSTAAIAIARRFGARVLGTTRSPAKAERAKKLGVEAVHIGYDAPFNAWVLDMTDGGGVDLVIDSVGAATWRQGIRSLAKGGALVVCGATSGDVPEISIRELYQNHRRILGAPLGNVREFERVMDLVFAGELVPVIDRTFELDAIGDALVRLGDQEQFGKITLRV